MEREEFVAKDSGISPEGLLVRRAYCLGMQQTFGKRGYGFYRIPQFDGGLTASGKRYDKNIWDRVAAVLSDNKFDAEEYIEFAFNSSDNVQSPNALLSPGLLARFHKVLEGEDKPTKWEFEENKLLTEITVQSCMFTDPIEALKAVLTNDANYVSPLVKYCFAVKNNAGFLVDFLRKDALKQYRRRRFFYDRYYKDNIPDELRELLDGAK